MDQIQRSFAAIKRGKPIEAEDDNDRKIKRLHFLMGVKKELVKKLAEYDKAVIKKIPKAKRSLAESVLGGSIDFVDIYFLDNAKAASKSVARVIKKYNWQATGFMISDELFITNQHAIKKKEVASDYMIEFNYELGINKKPKDSTTFKLDPDKFFLSSHQNDLDYTIVAVGEKDMGPDNLSSFGFCPLSDADDKHTKGEWVNIIQHPLGRLKQIVLRENRLAARSDKVLHYFTDTLGGSSGSPVFNDQFEPIGLHHYGGPSEEAFTPEGEPGPTNVNEGIRISVIIKDVVDRKENELDENQRDIIKKALNIPYRGPSLVQSNE